MWPTIRIALFETAPTIASAGSVRQGNALVGFGVGARRDKYDATRLDFTEITNASKFDVTREFEFQNYQLKLARVHVIREASPDGSRTLAGVTAKIVSQR